MFGGAIAVMIAALITMAADVYIWHIFIPQAIVLIVVTGLAFVISLILLLNRAKPAKTRWTTQAQNPPVPDKRSKIASRFGIAALVCFYIALAFNTASHLCERAISVIMSLIYMLAVLAAVAFAGVSITLSRRSTEEKAFFFSLLSLPLRFLIAAIAIMGVIAVALFIIMLRSWRDWGLI